jgi:predicted RNA-binding Zn-ribbon protein involved in translation (DUF1610 family)
VYIGAQADEQGGSEVLFTDAEVEQIADSIRSDQMPTGVIKSFQTRQAHLQSLVNRHASTSTCPKCGKPLVLRTAKSGADAGSRFYGCSGFPACRFTKPA